MVFVSTIKAAWPNILAFTVSNNLHYKPIFSPQIGASVSNKMLRLSRGS